MKRADLSAAEARRFRTGRVCLDFAHTGGGGPLAVWEIVHSPHDLERWLGVILDVDRVRARRADMHPAKHLRAAIWRSAQRIVAGEALARSDIAAINRAAQRPPLVPALRADGHRQAYVDGPASAALSTLARDAIDLFSGPLRARIRVCAANDCGLLFVDASRPGRRRWCSMQRCGNRAKKRAYRNRGEISEPTGPARA
jgi:predicted RNA-binding Zn ribbon-like protein